MRAVEAQPRPRGVGANCCNVSSRRNRGIARSLRRRAGGRSQPGVGPRPASWRSARSCVIAAH